MKNRRGFTLIELLAVIVILAVIALIATPAIINVIENSRKKAFENTAYGVLEGLRLDYTERVANNNTKESKFYEFPNSGLKLSGEQPAGGTASVDSHGNITFTLFDKDKKWCAKKESRSEKVTIEDYSEETCKIDGVSSNKCNTISFATDSWGTISCAVNNNELDNYKVGDEKTVTLIGEYAGTYIVRIANTSKPAECDSSGFSQSACGFVVEFKGIIMEAQMNLSGTNADGWGASEIYTLINTTIYNSLPDDLKKAIIDTDVVSSHGNQSGTTNYKSTDKLYLLATKEVWGKEGTSNQINSDTSDENTRQLDYYKKEGVTTNNYSGAIKQYNGTNNYWWLRSADFSYSSNFYNVSTIGSWKSYGADYNFGVSPAFRIG